MASEGIANLVATVQFVAPLVGLYLAWLGLHSWRVKIQYEQGRGLAVALLTQFERVARHIRRQRDLYLPSYDEKSEMDVKIQNKKKFESDIVRYLSELDREIEIFEDRAAEALIAWNRDISGVSESFRETERNITIALYEALLSIHPESHQSQRRAAAESYHSNGHKVRFDLRGADFSISASINGAKSELLQAIAEKVRPS